MYVGVCARVCVSERDKKTETETERRRRREKKSKRCAAALAKLTRCDFRVISGRFPCVFRFGASSAGKAWRRGRSRRIRPSA